MVRYLTSPRVLLVLCSIAQLTAQTSAYIRVGGSSYTDPATNQTWSADRDFNGGWPFSVTTPIANTNFSGLYQTQRINSSGDLIYNVPLANGTYSLTLRFAELWFSGAGSRIFNVAVNGTQVKQNLDVVAAAGGRFTAYNIQVPVSITNGILNIDLQPVRDNPMLNAIDVVPSNAVTLNPGNDVQQIVSANPAGTTFYFNAGTYYNQSITPKDGDVFQAAGGVVLNGSRTLTGQMIKNGGLWYAYDPDPGQPTGVYHCDDQHPACIYAEELYLNDIQLLRVVDPSTLGPGKWYFDTTNHQVIMADDPTGKTIEISATPAAFSGSAANVSISGLRVEKYANHVQFGAIGGQYPGPSWIMSNVEVRLNHGSGIQLASSSQVLNSFLHNNGSIGVGSSGSSGVLIQHNEISFNNTSGFLHDFEAGGGKFSVTTNLVARQNYVHDNAGSGFWTDTDNQNTLYENNIFFNNQDSGIQHECSFSAIFRNNVFSNNGSAKFVWLWGSQIIVQNSQSVEAYGNIINVASSFGNGIGIVNQNRGSGQFGAYVSQNNYLHDNDVTYQPGSNALSGLVADYDETWFYSSANNRFDSNHYHLNNSVSSAQWQWNGAYQTWGQFRTLSGLETSGSVDSSIQPPPSPTWQ